VARLATRLAEAEAALATLDEVVHKPKWSLVVRDSAILRLIYTFEAVWKACQQLLAEREGIEVASPNSTIRAARRLGWLPDEEAQTALGIAATATLRFTCIAGQSVRKLRIASPPTLLCCAAGSQPCDSAPPMTEHAREGAAVL
jgi:hypothetical protein